ncbi:MAG: hypothetical protein IPH09_15980 [bacterium]|nr:hypothetical protein [bacterium]
MAMILLLALAAPSVPAAAGEEPNARLVAAKALFERYMTLERAFDPAVADLYADSATVRNLRRYPTGQVREMKLEGARYKALLLASLPTAKERGDLSAYTDVAYEVLATGEVAITATRYSELKQYSSPLALRIAPQADGVWRIVEETGESQP